MGKGMMQYHYLLELNVPHLSYYKTQLFCRLGDKMMPASRDYWPSSSASSLLRLESSFIRRM